MSTMQHFSSFVFKGPVGPRGPQGLQGQQVSLFIIKLHTIGKRYTHILHKVSVT